MRKIDINLLTIPDFRGEESELKEILEGNSKHEEVSGIVLLDPEAHHQVKAVYILEEATYERDTQGQEGSKMYCLSDAAIREMVQIIDNTVADSMAFPVTPFLEKKLTEIREQLEEEK